AVLLIVITRANFVVLGDAENEIIEKGLDEFEKNPRHPRYYFCIQPSFEDAILVPKMFIWCPMHHFGAVILCPDHKCRMRFHAWTSKTKTRNFEEPRLVYDLFGNIILVQAIYKCPHSLENRKSSGHRYLSASETILKCLPRDVTVKFPIKLFYRSACSQALLDYIIVHIGRGQTFLELTEDISSMNFRSYTQLKDGANGSVGSFHNSEVYSFPSNDHLMYMFLAYFASKENLFQVEMNHLPCSILSCDHTFKVSKHIGVIRITDQMFVNQFENIFIWLNDNGQVVTWRLTRSTAFKEIEDLLRNFKDQLDAKGQDLKMIIVDDCCSVRQSYHRIFQNVPVYLDLYHACQRFIKTLPKGSPFSQKMAKEFGLIFRSDGDTGDQRKQVTPEPDIIESNMQMFISKWESRLALASADACKNIRKHIKKGCCSGIPPGVGTQKNERLHKYLKRSLLGGANTISPELAVAIFTMVFYVWSQKRSPSAKKHVSNSRVVPIVPVESNIQNLFSTVSSLRDHPKFKCDNIPKEIPAAVSAEQMNVSTATVGSECDVPNGYRGIPPGQVSALKNETVINYVISRALHLVEILSSVDTQCISRDFDVFDFPFSDLKTMIASIQPDDKTPNIQIDMNRECLNRHLASFGLEIDAVPGDGDCCFTSIMKQIYRCFESNDEEYCDFLRSLGFVGDIKKDVMQLRYLFCNEIRGNSAKYAPCVDFDIDTGVLKFSTSGWFRGSMGDLCVLACSNLLKAPIFIITAQPRCPYLPFIPTEIRSTRVLYVGPSLVIMILLVSAHKQMKTKTLSGMTICHPRLGNRDATVGSCQSIGGRPVPVLVAFQALCQNVLVL
ncbi:uncharacterized protein LOC5518042, partial [Nematostella vectensis]|uniref:uncharacterized protein LOC5518042 n=1 Tax=Nematostella vectensis TaxID=45351 RepID=UPI001390265C